MGCVGRERGEEGGVRSRLEQQWEVVGRVSPREAAALRPSSNEGYVLMHNLALLKFHKMTKWSPHYVLICKGVKEMTKSTL